MFKCSMGSGQGPQGKLEGLFVGSFNNCFGNFAKKLHVNDKIRDPRQANMSPEHYF